MGLSGGYQVAGRVCRIGRHQLLSRSRDCHYPASAAIRHYAEWVIRKDSLSCQTFYSNNRYLTYKLHGFKTGFWSKVWLQPLLIYALKFTEYNKTRTGKKMPRCPPNIWNLDSGFRNIFAKC